MSSIRANKSYRCLRITIANELVNLKEILINFELGIGQIFSTRQVFIGSSSSFDRTDLKHPTHNWAELVLFLSHVLYSC